ncbi:MAG: RNA polymerase factor sigma-54 [Phycisphaerales bacterium]|nr:MAG: RNA polymerase factor sigma-54 [Phycisphaerales bacterium]
MSQYMSQIPAQVLRQEQRLTPQLIQSMDILQLPLMALEQRINQELQTNPVLEYEFPDRGSDDAPPEPPDQREETAPQDGETAESFDHLERLIQENDFDPGDQPYARVQSQGETDAKMEAMANTASRPESLQELLLVQWQFLSLPDDVRRAGEVIIDFIEDDGYLRTDLQTVAGSVEPPLNLELAEAALAEIHQKLEPAGIGARTLEECLLLQLQQQPGDNELPRTLILGHLTDIQKNRYPAIAKATGSSIEQIKEAVEQISRLHPQPGVLLAGGAAPVINPDVIVEYDDEEESGYSIRLARGNEPHLRISPYYRRMLAQKNGDRNTRDFIRRNLEAAKALIDAIKFRKERLLEVARVVVERQGEFFERGPAALKILRMSELAEAFGCDPSTISRTVADKHMQTPRGIYPMRYFFTGGTEMRDGETTSWDSVRARVKEIIDQEDRRNPLNDDQIAAILKKEKVDVSRRTIAKYRQLLDIPAARQRKAY